MLEDVLRYGDGSHQHDAMHAYLTERRAEI